jgi:hypothetical protein
MGELPRATPPHRTRVDVNATNETGHRLGDVIPAGKDYRGVERVLPDRAAGLHDTVPQLFVAFPKGHCFAASIDRKGGAPRGHASWRELPRVCPARASDLAKRGFDSGRRFRSGGVRTLPHGDRIARGVEPYLWVALAGRVRGDGGRGAPRASCRCSGGCLNHSGFVLPR